MLDTLTRLYWDILACLSASSNEASFSRWRPTPFVKKTLVGIIIYAPRRCMRLYLRISVVAYVGTGDQRPGEVTLDQHLRGLRRGSYEHLDAVFGE